MTRQRPLTYEQLEARVQKATAQVLDDVIYLTEHYLYASPLRSVPESVLDELVRLWNTKIGRREIEARPALNPILLAVVWRGRRL